MEKINEVDVKPTVRIIEDMANNLEHYAQELRFLADKMRATQDLSYATEAAINIFQNMRLDLLISRPLRAMGIK